MTLIAKRNETPSHGSTMPENTPWGQPDQAVRIASIGVWSVKTASHGGLYLSPKAQTYLPTSVRKCLINGPAWAEEKCEMAIVLAILAPMLDPGTMSREFGAALETQDDWPLRAAWRNCRESESYAPCAPHLPRQQDRNAVRSKPSDQSQGGKYASGHTLRG